MHLAIAVSRHEAFASRFGVENFVKLLSYDTTL